MHESYQIRVRKKQARIARAQHLVTCRLVHGKKKASGKQLTELYVEGRSTEDREEDWQKNWRHCAKGTHRSG